MQPEPLPPDLREFEEQLARRSAPEPATNFRARVLQVMSDARRPAMRSAVVNWRRLCRVAVAVALILNLILTVENGIRFRRLTKAESAPAGDAPWFYRPLPTSDANTNDRFDSIAANAVASLRPAPDVGVMKTNILEIEKVHPWAMP